MMVTDTILVMHPAQTILQWIPVEPQIPVEPSDSGGTSDSGDTQDSGGQNADRDSAPSSLQDSHEPQDQPASRGCGPFRKRE